MDEATRRQIVLDHLGRLEAKLFELEVVQIVNGALDEDPVPDRPLRHDGHVTSYAEERQTMVDAVTRLRQAYPSLMPSDGDVKQGA